MRDDKLLHIYLADHLAGANAGLEVAKRCLANNRGTALGEFLEHTLIPQIDEDKRTLESVMDAVGAPRNALKNAAGWLAVRAGRLKLNGRLTSYSPLSRLEELEGLCLGVEGKLSLWRALRSVAGRRPLGAFDYDELIARATRQREGLEGQRAAAATLALAGDSGG
jgi:hypothetical protein